LRGTTPVPKQPARRARPCLLQHALSTTKRALFSCSPPAHPGFDQSRYSSSRRRRFRHFGHFLVAALSCGHSSLHPTFLCATKVCSSPSRLFSMGTFPVIRCKMGLRDLTLLLGSPPGHAGPIPTKASTRVLISLIEIDPIDSRHGSGQNSELRR
jgi:hypothetical protein